MPRLSFRTAVLINVLLPILAAISIFLFRWGGPLLGTLGDSEDAALGRAFALVFGTLESLFYVVPLWALTSIILAVVAFLLFKRGRASFATAYTCVLFPIVPLLLVWANWSLYSRFVLSFLGLER